MIAQVYPVIRMPQSRAGSGGGVFDYAIPDQRTVGPGDVVRMPFRGRSVLGVVKHTMQTSAFSSIKSLADQPPLFRLSAREVAYLEDVAKDLGISVPTVLYNAFPTPGIRGPKVSHGADSTRALSIPTSDVERLSSNVRALRQTPRSFVWCEDLRYAAALISGYLSSNAAPTLVLCPNVRDVELVASFLHALAPSIITGDETEPRRFANWMRWREHDGLLIGTRIAALLTHPHLRTIFVLRSGHENHREPKRVPPFDARLAAQRLADRFDARLAACDVSPTAAQASANVTMIGHPPETPTTIVSRTKERPHAQHVFVTASVSSEITRALEGGKRVLAVLNRKDATSNVGLGISEAARGLKAAFPSAVVATLEKQTGSVPHADILVTTRFYLENIFDPSRPESFGLVADLDADALLYSAHASGVEQTVRAAFEWQSVAHASRCPFLIQTTRPDFFERVLSDPIRLLKDESAAADAYRDFVDNTPKI